MVASSRTFTATRTEMPHRQFKGHGDITWEVWDVHPLEVARRLIGNDSESDETARRRTRTSVARDLASGWLCFESPEEKRRLSPIPAAWDRLTDEQLLDLCGRAKNAPVRRTAT